MPAPGQAPEAAHPDPEVLSRFASVVGHELRNPLSAVKIALQSLERRVPLPPKDLTRLRIALREVDNIERVLSDLVEWARPEPLEVTPLRVRELAEAALEVAAPVLEDRHLGAAVEGLEALPPVLADRARTANALAELVCNAALVSPAGGSVRLSARTAEGAVEVFVDDRGPGLDPAQRERVFAPFVTLQAGRIGLGLTLARQSARAQGGDVRLEDAPGGGLRAVLLLRRA